MYFTKFTVFRKFYPGICRSWKKLEIVNLQKTSGLLKLRKKIKIARTRKISKNMKLLHNFWCHPWKKNSVRKNDTQHCKILLKAQSFKNLGKNPFICFSQSCFVQCHNVSSRDAQYCATLTLSLSVTFWCLFSTFFNENSSATFTVAS